MKNLRQALVWLSVGLVVGPAAAQLGLPPVSLPTLPVGLPPLIPDTLKTATDGVGSTARAGIRIARLAELLRAYPDVLERDPDGNAIVRSQLLAIAPSDAALAAATAEGYIVLRTQSLSGLDTTIVTLQAPARMRTARALRRLRTLDPAGQYDFNPLYLDSGEISAGPAVQRPDEPATTPLPGTARARVGLIDGGIDSTHPALRSGELHLWGCDTRAIPSAHGTAVASLLAGNALHFHGAAPGAAIYAADVNCGQPTGGNVETIAEAFAWLAREQVPVINVSLVGPPNNVLKRVVDATLARGSLIVAAVGNDGPAAPPLYPAAYPGVIGVTGVDARRRVLVEAARGPQVFIAAPGADLVAAAPDKRYAQVRGTSFAAPLVAGLLAQALPALDARAAKEVVNELVARAIDLGSPGFDTTYGHGLVGEALRVPGPVDISAENSAPDREETGNGQRH